MDKAWWMVKLFKIARAVLRRGRQGVSKVAFKLTKSNISQIRLWLLLREWKKGEGAGKNEVKYTRNGWGNRCNASKKESWGSWWGMIEKNKDRQTHLLKKGGAEKEKSIKKWGVWKWERLSNENTCEFWCCLSPSQRVQWMNPETPPSSPAGFYHLHEKQLEHTLANIINLRSAVL